MSNWWSNILRSGWDQSQIGPMSSLLFSLLNPDTGTPNTGNGNGTQYSSNADLDYWNRMNGGGGSKTDQLLKALQSSSKSNPYAANGGPAYNQYWNNPNRVAYGGQMGSNAAMGIPQPDANPDQQSAQQKLIQQLLAGLNAGKPVVKTPDQIKKEAASTIGMQFNPQIKSIQQLMTDARKDSGLNAKDIKALYADLAGSYDADAKFAQNEIAKAKADEVKSLGGLQSRNDQQYNGQMADQAAEFQKLGIQDALPQATKNQVDDRAFLNSLNNTESAAQQRFLGDMGLSESNYYRRGAGIAQQRGNESVESLLGNVDQYLKQEGGQLSDLQGQKGSAISQLVSQMTQANNSAYGSWDSDRWSRMAQMLGLLNQSDSQNFNQQMALLKASQAGQGGNAPTKGIEGAYGVLSKLLGNNSGNTISALQNFLQGQTQREGTFRDPNNQPRDMTPQQAAYEARQYGTQMKLSPAEIDALVQSVYAYYGKLS